MRTPARDAAALPAGSGPPGGCTVPAGLRAARLRRGAALVTAAAALAAAAVLPSGALGGARAASTHTVVLRETRFHPANLTIRRDDSVRWLWRDQTEHNVTFRRFHSRTQETGSYTVRFTRAGSYDYHCTIHVSEGMRGRIVVR